MLALQHQAAGYWNFFKNTPFLIIGKDLPPQPFNNMFSHKHHAENHLKLLACYLVHHQKRISRKVNIANVTLFESIRTLRELRDFEMTYKASDDTLMVKAKDWPKIMESIQEYLQSYLGEPKTPLAYFVRKDDAIPTTKRKGGYLTVIEWMICCASKHFTLGSDGMKVLGNLSLEINPAGLTSNQEEGHATAKWPTTEGYTKTSLALIRCTIWPQWQKIS